MVLETHCSHCRDLRKIAFICKIMMTLVVKEVAGSFSDILWPIFPIHSQHSNKCLYLVEK